MRSFVYTQREKTGQIFLLFFQIYFQMELKKKVCAANSQHKTISCNFSLKIRSRKTFKKKHYTDLKCFTPPTEIMIHFNFKNRSDIHFRIESFSALIVFPSIVRTRPTRPHSQNGFLCCTKCKACGGVRGYGNGMK